MLPSPLRRLLGLALVGAAVAGCSEPAAPPPGPAAAAAPDPSQPAGFVDVVWRVTASPQVEPGALYVFLSTGTLIVDSRHGTPMSGSWSAKDGKLDAMVEEGISYPVEVLSLDAHQFKIRSHNPGQPVELTLERATAPR